MCCAPVFRQMRARAAVQNIISCHSAQRVFNTPTRAQLSTNMLRKYPTYLGMLAQSSHDPNNSWNVVGGAMEHVRSRWRYGGA